MKDLPNIIKNLLRDGSLKEIVPFQENLFSINEMYELKERQDYSNAYKTFGVIPDSFIHDYYGVEPTKQYYYRR